MYAYFYFLKLLKQHCLFNFSFFNFFNFILEKLDLDVLWDDISDELSEIVNGYAEATDDISAIDVLLQVDDDVHQQFAMLLVQRALRERRVADSVGIYRAARLLWPNDNLFGFDGMAPESEFIELYAIFFADLTEVNYHIIIIIFSENKYLSYAYAIRNILKKLLF